MNRACMRADEAAAAAKQGDRGTITHWWSFLVGRSGSPSPVWAALWSPAPEGPPVASIPLGHSGSEACLMT